MPKGKRRFKLKVWISVGRVRSSSCNSFCLRLSVKLPPLPSDTECNIKCLRPYLGFDIAKLFYPPTAEFRIPSHSTSFLRSIHPVDAVALSTGGFAAPLAAMWFVLGFQLWLLEGSAICPREMPPTVCVLWAMCALSGRFVVRYAVGQPLILS